MSPRAADRSGLSGRPQSGREHVAGALTAEFVQGRRCSVYR
jgi:hypothetical protein